MIHRYALIAAALFTGSAAAAQAAAPIVLSCTEPLPLSEVVVQHAVTLTEGAAASLAIEGPIGPIGLPARIERPEGTGMLLVNAEGPALTPMPDKADVDACLAAHRKSSPDLFAGGEINDSLAMGCRLKARPTAAPVPVHMKVTMIMFSAAAVDQFFVERAYAGDDEAATRLYGVASFPMWSCKVLSGL